VIDLRILDYQKHLLADRIKQVQLPQLHADRSQTGTRRKMARRFAPSLD
jgi:hypothetical protein